MQHVTADSGAASPAVTIPGANTFAGGACGTPPGGHVHNHLTEHTVGLLRAQSYRIAGEQGDS